MNESELLAKVLIKLKSFRIFRNHRGKAYQGKAFFNKDKKSVTIHNPRFYEFGLIQGASDLIGWKNIKITKDMVDQNIAQFVAIEGKAGKDRLSEYQSTFLENVRRSGGIALVAVDKDDNVELLAEFEHLKVKKRASKT